MCCTAAVHGFGQGFARLQSEIGLDHLYDPRGHLGGGAVVLDINNDGYMDLYLPGGEAGEVLLLNNNGESFTDITFSAGLTVLNNFYTFGGVAGDFNRDGFEDLFITTWQFVETWGGPNYDVANRLMLNNGNNTFTNAGGFAGILESAFSASATLLDVNYDGFLDIYVANYVENANLIYNNQGQVVGFAHDCYENFLYVSSNGQEYDEMAEAYGVSDHGCALAAAATDYNNDTYTDIMVVNDFGQWVLPNKLYAGQYDAFTDVTENTGNDVGIYGMGVAVGDYDEDGDMDYYMTNIGRNVLLRQEQAGTWTDETTPAGVENSFQSGENTTSWGTVFFDYDNDSYLDLYVSNGYLPTAPFLGTAYYDPNKMYENNQDGTFTDIAVEVNLRDTALGRGAVVFDFNNDGKLDVLQVNVYDQVNAAPQGTVLYLNETENDNNFVMFSLEGTTSNPHGIGARVELYAGGRKLIREVDGGASHASHGDKRVHFGLGQIQQIDTVMVYWPGQPQPQILVEPAINQIHDVVQSDVVTSTSPHLNAATRIFPNPTTGPLTLLFNQAVGSELKIRLSDASGRMVKEEAVNVPGNKLLDLSGWLEGQSTGLYLLSIRSQHHVESHRVALSR